MDELLLIKKKVPNSQTIVHMEVNDNNKALLIHCWIIYIDYKNHILSVKEGTLLTMYP